MHLPTYACRIDPSLCRFARAFPSRATSSPTSDPGARATCSYDFPYGSCFLPFACYLTPNQPDVSDPEAEALALEAVESPEAEAPRAPVHAVSTRGDVGAEVAAAEVLGVEERHCSLILVRNIVLWRLSG